MSTRVTKYSQEFLKKFLAAWNGSIPRLFDHERTLEAAMMPLEMEPNTQVYALPEDSFLLLRNALVGNGSVVQIISPGEKLFPQLGETQQVLAEAVREYRLRRVSVIAPSPIEWRDYKLLGFKHEGRVRKGALFNNQWTDVEMLGALEHEIGKSHRRTRKRYRKHKPPGQKTKPLMEITNASESE